MCVRAATRPTSLRPKTNRKKMGTGDNGRTPKNGRSNQRQHIVLPRKVENFRTPRRRRQPKMKLSWTAIAATVKVIIDSRLCVGIVQGKK